MEIKCERVYSTYTWICIEYGTIKDKTTYRLFTETKAYIYAPKEIT